MSPGSRPPGPHPTIGPLVHLLAATVTACLWCLPALAVQAPRSSRSVITYFVARNVHGKRVVEWRIFDPASRVDTLFATVGAKNVNWDTSGTSVEYVAGGQLLRLQWEWGAQPWPILQLPAGGLTDCWFNPDSSCWQAAAVGGVPRNYSSNEPPYAQCHSELWESDRDGHNWRIIGADTSSCGGCYFCETWSLSGNPAIRRKPSAGLKQLQNAMTADAWGGPPEPTWPPDGGPQGPPDWYFIPFRTIPKKGLDLRIGTRNGVRVVRAPFFLMDLRRGTAKELETPYMRQEDWQLGFEERDGFLLVTGLRTYVFDLRTGELIFSPPEVVVQGAAWINPPAPPSVDKPGLQRLRQRFR